MKKVCKVWSILIITLFLIIVFSVPNLGEEKKPYQVRQATSEIKIDGILNEKAWQEALNLELKYEVEPGENIKPPVKTEALLVYGSRNLYVAFRAYDADPSAIRAWYTDRDHIWEDDYVGIVLDTFNDSRRSYDFYCNPFGIQGDRTQALLGEGGVEWDAIWHSAGRITETGYIVEMAIPFSSLRFQRKKGEQVWGIDIVRSYPRNLKHLIGLFPRDRSDNCYMCQAEKITLFKRAGDRKNLEFDPTLSAIYTQERESFPDGKFIEKTGKIDPGLTARWSFTSNLTLGAALNPDFSQVEADAAQLDINTQFTLYYPEKRPFFLEGATIFNTRLFSVYTRTMADPDWGIKLTGKEGGNAVGFFSVQDNITNLVFPGSESSSTTSLDMKSQSTVLRYRRDVGKSSNLGIIVTDREGEDYFNRLAGLDGDLRITKKDRVLFQFIGAQTRYPDQVAADNNQSLEDLWGYAFDVLYQHYTEHVRIYAHCQEVSANFRADIGHIPQSDFRFINTGASYLWRRDPGSWYTTFRVGAFYRNEQDHQGNLLFEAFRPYVMYYGPLQSSLVLYYNTGRMSYKGVEFNDAFFGVDSSLRPFGSLSLSFHGLWGDRIDFSNVRAGRRLRLNPILEYKTGRHLSFGIDHVFERLNVDAGRLYTANISNLRMVYQFSKRAFLRTILQYVNYTYDPELYTIPRNPEYKHFFSQVLFSYKINPQTVLFLGYSDDYFGDYIVQLTQKNRTFFLKIGYALVL